MLDQEEAERQAHAHKMESEFQEKNPPPAPPRYFEVQPLPPPPPPRYSKVQPLPPPPSPRSRVYDTFIFQSAKQKSFRGGFAPVGKSLYILDNATLQFIQGTSRTEFKFSCQNDFRDDLT